MYIPILLFVIGLTRFLDIDVFGRIVVSEVIMLLAFPFIVASRVNCLRSRVYLIFAGLLFLTGAIVLFSDAKVNGVHITFSLKGLARLGFLGVIASFWYLVLVDGIDRLKYFLYGSLPGAILAIFRVSEFDREGVQSGGMGYDFWLSKLGPLMLVLICIGAYHLFNRVKIGVVALFITGGAISLVFAARSVAAFYVLTASAVFIVWWFTRRGVAVPRLRLRDYVVFFVSAGAVASVVYILYVSMAPAGLLGEYQQQKFFKQSNTLFGVTPWGLVLGGRVDFVQCLLAIHESPTWGLGSWNIPHSYLISAYELLGLDVPRYIRSLDAGLLTSGHSIVFGLWATNGIFTLPLWVYVFYLVLRFCVRLLYLSNGVMPFLFHTSLVVLFSLFFNPFSLGARNSIGLIVGAIVALSYLDNSQRVASRSGGRSAEPQVRGSGRSRRL